jgi:hypothetical protein
VTRLDLCLFDSKSDERKSLHEVEFDTIGRLILPIHSNLDHFEFYCFEMPVPSEPLSCQQLSLHCIHLPNPKLLYRPLSNCFVFPNRLVCLLRPLKPPSNTFAPTSKGTSEDPIHRCKVESAPFAVCLVNVLEAINLPTLNIQHPVYVCHVQLGTHHFHTRMQRNRSGCPRFDQSFAAALHDLNEPLQVQVMLKESEQNPISLGAIHLDLLSFYSLCRCTAKVQSVSSPLLRTPTDDHQPTRLASQFEPLALCSSCNQTRSPPIDQEINFRVIWLPIENDYEPTSGFVRLRVGVQRLFCDPALLTRTLNQLQNLNSNSLAGLANANWIDKPLAIPLALFTIEVQRVHFEAVRRLSRLTELNATVAFYLSLTYADQTSRVLLPSLSTLDTTFPTASVVPSPIPSKRLVQFVCWHIAPKQKMTFTLQAQPHKSRSLSLATAVLQIVCPYADHYEPAPNAVSRNASVTSIDLQAPSVWSMQDASLDLLLTCPDRTSKQRYQRTVANATIRLRAQYTDLRNECVVNLLSDRRPHERISRPRSLQTVGSLIVCKPSPSTALSTSANEAPGDDSTDITVPPPTATAPSTPEPSSTAKSSAFKAKRWESNGKSNESKAKKRTDTSCAILIAFSQPHRHHLVVDLIRLIDVPLFDSNQLPSVRVRVNLWCGIERLGQGCSKRLPPSRDPFVGDRFEFELPARMSGRLLIKLQLEQIPSWFTLVTILSPADNVLAEAFINVPPLEPGGVAPADWFNLVKVGM